MPPLTWTARSLVNRILSLLRKYPALFFPVVVADLISFAAMHIQHALHQPLFAWVFREKASVLATAQSDFVLTPQNAAEAALLTMPLLWGCYFLSVCLYSGALFITSTFVQMASRKKPLDCRSALSLVIKNKRRLLVFSLSIFGALIIAAVIGGSSIAGSMHVPWLASRMGKNFGYLTALILEIIVVYLFAQPTLKLLSNTTPLNSAKVRMAISLGIITVITQAVLALFIDHIAAASTFRPTTVITFLIYEAATSLIGALPYVPFFIGLSLLAANSEPVTFPEELGEVEGQ